MENKKELTPETIAVLKRAKVVTTISSIVLIGAMCLLGYMMFQ